MGLLDSLWFCMVSLLVRNGFYSFFNDSLWFFTDGSLCFFLVFHVSSWFSIIPGSLLFFIVFLSFQWFSMVLARFFSLKMLTMLPGFSCFVVVLYVLHGPFLFFVVLSGSSWIFMFLQILSEYLRLSDLFLAHLASALFFVFVWFLIFFSMVFTVFLSLVLHDRIFVVLFVLWKNMIASSATKIFQLEDYFF
jgi:hypothetical protein